MIFFWLFLINLTIVFGAQEVAPPCSIEGVIDSNWWLETYNFRKTIDDNHEGIIAEYKCTNVKEALIKDSKYLTATLTDNILEISVTDEFKNFEENESDVTIKEDLYIKCLHEEESTTPTLVELNEDELAEKEELDDTEYHLLLTQGLNDLNTFAPKFTKDEYIFEYYQDLLSSHTLTSAQRVSVEDKDISTSKNSVSLSIEKNDYFTITSGNSDDLNKKLIYAIVSTTKYIEAPFNETFTITAVDSGEPEVKSSTAKLTVLLFSEQTLVFTKSIYQAEFDGKNIKITDGPIAIEGGQDLNTEFEIFSDDDIADNFEITQNIQSIEINLTRSLNETLVEERDYLYLTVVANKVGRIGHFAVIIKVNGGQSTTTEEPVTTPSAGGIETNLQAFEDWILAGTTLIWISFSLLVIAFLMVMFSFKKYWQMKYNV